MLRSPIRPYDVLGISPNADYETVKAAFRKAVKSCHPDLNPGSREAERRLRQVIAARRTILRNLERRENCGRRPRGRRLNRGITSAGLIIAAFLTVAGGGLVVSYLLPKNETPAPFYSSPPHAYGPTNAHSL